MKAVASKVLCRFALVAVATLPATLVYAEQADRKKPITIEGDLVTLDQAKLIRTLEGNVILVQGTMRLTAERIIVKEDAAGSMTAQAFGTPNKQIAFRQKREAAEDFVEGSADRVEFDDLADTVQLFSRARLKSGANELTGEYIYYNAATEIVKMRDAVPGASSATAGSTNKGRPTITIQPKTPDEKSTLAAPVKRN